MTNDNQGQGVARQEALDDRESVRDFISIAAHDLREPIRAIRLGARMLGAAEAVPNEAGRSEAVPNEAVRNDENIAKGARYILEGADRLETLIRDISEYCYEEVREPELRETDVECALLEAKSELAGEIKRAGAKITQDSLPVLMANSASLAAVFRCLIGNACKFRGEAPLEIHVAAVQKGSGWTFSVQDNGVGFEPAYNDRIFRPFERLNGKQYPGSGLGLTLARKIIEQHGGRIWAESSPGRGTTIHFYLPV